MASRRSPAARRSVHLSEVVSVPPSGEFRAVVVADTHSHPHPNAHALIQKLAPQLIFHAGDIGDLGVLDPLRELAPLIAVRGNIDERASDLADSIDVELISGERRILKLILTHIAVYGPHLRADIARLAATHAARVVLCGHSHVPFLGRSRGIVVFNPGSIGPRRFQLPITLGLLQIAPSGISLKHISCETEQEWLP